MPHCFINSVRFNGKFSVMNLLCCEIDHFTETKAVKSLMYQTANRSSKLGLQTDPVGYYSRCRPRL